MSDKEYADKCIAACEGLPDGALDGGWTASGMSAYAATLERDAARYRWLRDKKPQRWEIRYWRGYWACCTDTAGQNLDAAIDAEMLKTPNAKVSGAGTASAGLPGYAGDNNGE